MCQQDGIGLSRVPRVESFTYRTSSFFLTFSTKEGTFSTE
jgi:hypothetical protein